MICPFKEKECIHPNWADCQFEFNGDEPQAVELWLRGEEDKMGRNCCWLPEGINRTEMMEALGAFGEEAKRRVLENIKTGNYGEKKREMYKRRR